MGKKNVNRCVDFALGFSWVFLGLFPRFGFSAKVEGESSVTPPCWITSAVPNSLERGRSFRWNIRVFLRFGFDHFPF